MNKPHIFEGEDSRNKLLSGIDKVANIVKQTLGPCGSNVVLKTQYNDPIVINDGVSIAKEIKLEDPTENAGAKILTSAASTTNSVAGDGTTTTCILTQGLIREGFKAIKEGCNPILLREALQNVSKYVISQLEEQAKGVSDLESLKKVATISVGGDETLGKLIGEVVHRSGSEGIVNIENNNFPEVRSEIVEGYKINNGYMTPYAINDIQNFKVNYSGDNCFVVCCYHKLVDIKDLEPLLVFAHKSYSPILLIVESMDENLFQLLQLNIMKKIVQICPIKAPGFGFNVRDYMNDIAKMTGCTVFADDTKKLREFKSEDLGRAEKVTATREATCILRSKHIEENLKEYVEALKNQLKATENEHLRDSLKERISKLTVGVSTISIGAKTETEQAELKLRIEDAINATKAALKEGIVAGGGAALAKISNDLVNSVETDEFATKEQAKSYKIIAHVLQLPENQIIINSGGDNFYEGVRPSCNFGYNGRTRQFEDLMESGIVDPLLVVKSAFENAISSCHYCFRRSKLLRTSSYIFKYMNI